MTNIRLYTLAEIAKECGLNYETVWRHVRRGKLHATKFGNSYAVTEGAYVAWINDNKQLIDRKKAA